MANNSIRRTRRDLSGASASVVDNKIRVTDIYDTGRAFYIIYYCCYYGSDAEAASAAATAAEASVQSQLLIRQLNDEEQNVEWVVDVDDSHWENKNEAAFVVGYIHYTHLAINPMANKPASI